MSFGGRINWQNGIISGNRVQFPSLPLTAKGLLVFTKCTILRTSFHVLCRKWQCCLVSPVDLIDKNPAVLCQVLLVI